MASSTHNNYVTMLIGIVASTMVATCAAGNFFKDFDITWGHGNAKMWRGGQLLSLSMNKYSGSGFQSKRDYLFGRIDMDIKLVPGNSAGSVTTFYLSSQGKAHDEIDFEFLGNVSGQPYTLHTNVYAQGKGNKEQQFKLWFDPTRNFHTYSIIWKPQHIIFLVDNTPIRVYRNAGNLGVPFPTKQPMKIYASLWNADDWATRGGRDKADWSKAPFIAYYRNFRSTPVSSKPNSRAAKWQASELDANGKKRLRWVQMKYMIYNYCNDRNRFREGLPVECRRSKI